MTNVVLVTRAKLKVSSGASDFCNVGTSTFWFPVAPGTTTLPAPPAATTNANPLPANAVAVPEHFDSSDLCYLFQDLLPVGQAAVYATELDPDYVLPPYEEEIPLVGITLSSLSVTEYPYALTLPSQTVALVTKSAISIPTYYMAGGAGSYALTGQAADKAYLRKVTGGAGAFTLSGLSSGFVRDYVVGTNLGTFSLTGNSSDLIYGRLPLSADAGSFTLDGQDAIVGPVIPITGEVGAFTMTGEDATFARQNRVAIADAGTFTLSGQNAGLIYTTPASGKILTYTGNASTQSITGAGFKPGLMFIARESAASDVYVHDKANGSTKYWRWDQTSALTTNANTVSSFDSNGFSLGNSSLTNGNTLTYVSYLIKEVGSASSNTNGTITTTVSVDDTLGYSIFTYTGNGTNNATIGHGLSAAPELILVKRTDTTAVGRMGGSLVGANNAMDITSTAVRQSESTMYQAFGSTTVQLGTSSDVNASGGTYTAYAFRSTDSIKCGTYSSNGGGVYSINLGWRPAFFLLKGMIGSNNNWLMFYRTASGDGTTNYNVLSNTTDAPSTSAYEITSTGFSVPINGFGNVVGGGNTAMYLAFRQ